MLIRISSHTWKHRRRNLWFYVRQVGRQHLDTMEAAALSLDFRVGKVWGLWALWLGTWVLVGPQEKDFS